MACLWMPFFKSNIIPFSADNSWSAGLLKIFEVCRDENKPLENHYYGPHYKLLKYCYRDSFAFLVAPPNPSGDNSSRDPSLHFIIFSIVFDVDRRPVLIAEIKDNSLASDAGLLEADKQLQSRYNTMLDICPLPRL